MPEWLPTNDGRPLKTTDALLDWGFGLMSQNALQSIEIEDLRAELMVAVEAALVNR